MLPSRILLSLGRLQSLPELPVNHSSASFERGNVHTTGHSTQCVQQGVMCAGVGPHDQSTLKDLSTDLITTTAVGDDLAV